MQCSEFGVRSSEFRASECALFICMCVCVCCFRVFHAKNSLQFFPLFLSLVRFLFGWPSLLYSYYTYFLCLPSPFILLSFHFLLPFHSYRLNIRYVDAVVVIIYLPFLCYSVSILQQRNSRDNCVYIP